MEHRTTVKLHVEGADNEWIPCAIVSLFDRDRLSRDDFLGTNITNAYGEAVFTFHDDAFLDVDDAVGGALPELYVKVFGEGGRLVLSTRVSAERNAVPALIRVAVPRDLAQAHGLV